MDPTIGDENVVVCTVLTTKITRRTMRRLRKEKWLDDTAITMFMLLMQHKKRPEDVQVFNTHFWLRLSQGYKNVWRWTTKMDVFSKKYLFIPINENDSHWVMLVVNFYDQTISFFDSLGGDGSKYIRSLKKYLGLELLRKQVVQTKTAVSSYWKKWQFMNESKSAMQQNGFDCGVFVCMCRTRG